MGILGLTKLVNQKSTTGMREDELKNYFGRRFAIDASMTIYQFLIAMKEYNEGQGQEMTNEAGEVTSHLLGLWSRSLRLLDYGIKPVYVFDGAAPELKKAELEGRKAKAAEAAAALEQAVAGEAEDDVLEKLSKRTVRMSREQVADCKRLLTLMGLPVVEAPSEAEAQCAELVRGGRCYAVATEDMDALPFGSAILLRNVSVSEAKKKPICEFRLETVLREMGMTMDMFIDMCILLGCDYCGKIPGIGPHRAYEGIMQHKTMEAFLASLDPAKHPVPPNFDFVAAREFFRHPPVIPAADAKIDFVAPDEAGLIQFLVTEKLFARERVDKGIDRLKAALATRVQRRLEDFFTRKPVDPSKASTAAVGTGGGPKVGQKRPAEQQLPMGKLQRTGASNGAKKAVQKK